MKKIHFKGLEPITASLENCCSIQIELKVLKNKLYLMEEGLEPSSPGL